MKTLASDGGKPVRTKPFPMWPNSDEDEIEAVNNVLRSGKLNYWTGEEGRAFEREFAEFSDCKYSVALTNGTVALELALYSLGIKPGDEVIVTSRTFIASASCIVMRQAIPVIADVDRKSQNLTAETIEKVLSPKTRAIIAVHLAGWPCDMDPILDLAKKNNLWVIEDCAQATGSRYKGRPIGSFGDAAAFSFCQDKIFTTGGEGGMLTTNNRELWEKSWAFKDHGKSFDAVYFRKHKPGFRWVHESFGTNWRITEMQSAIGRIALKKVKKWVGVRRDFASMLNKSFLNFPALRVTIPEKEFFHSYYKYYVFVEPKRLKENWTRDRIVDAINAEGIPCFRGSCGEIYLEKAFTLNNLGPIKRLRIAKELGETSLMFLVHPTLSKQEIKDTISAVEKVTSAALK
ncbi:DegT/DnrJ/EryC1/StrS aminotransferase family protein [bacterium]|nr:DegT/DnrJ/EryC1/StrS aminotransferase family protein [bacterium]